MKVVMSVGSEIQPTVITTFDLSDLMALTGDLSLRTDTACVLAPS